MTEPRSGTSATAIVAIRSFSSAFTMSRASTIGWWFIRSTGIAPPWTRRSSCRPCMSERSRRIVSVVTP